MAHVQRVATSRVVDVLRRVVGVEAVVGRVVEPPERQDRPPVASLPGVVVDDVQDDLDPGPVELADHRLELVDRRESVATGGVDVVRREEPDRVVSPVVGEPHLDQAALGNRAVHREQLDRGDAERLQVLDDRRRRHTEVGAPQLPRHPGVGHRQALDMRLVDEGLVPRDVGATIAVPVEVGGGDDRPGDVGGAVLPVVAQP